MLFQSDAPVSHRLAFVLAVTFTVKPLLDLASGVGSPAPQLATAGSFCLVVVYLWVRRRSSRRASAAGVAPGERGGVMDSFQTKYGALPAADKVTYWVLLILGAVAMYALFTRDV